MQHAACRSSSKQQAASSMQHAGAAACSKQHAGAAASSMQEKGPPKRFRTACSTGEHALASSGAGAGDEVRSTSQQHTPADQTWPEHTTCRDKTCRPANELSLLRAEACATRRAVSGVSRAHAPAAQRHAAALHPGPSTRTQPGPSTRTSGPIHPGPNGFSAPSSARPSRGHGPSRQP
jgi:hypothetical protein